MNLIAIGDIHGRSNWKDIVEKENANRFVFIGDYFDSHEPITPIQQLNNFEEILAYKRKNPEQVTLLIGNHDYHYLNYTGKRYSGYQSAMAFDFENLLKQALKDNLMEMCFVIENLVFTHAGITRTWAGANDIDLENLQGSVNECFREKPQAFEFTTGENHDPTGDDITQSPIWVRMPSLLKDKIPGYIQVVGHTMSNRIEENNGVYLIDTLGTSGEYLYWDEDGFSVRSVS